MNEGDRLRLRHRLKLKEAFSAQPYRDSRGFLTIGYGRLIDPEKGGSISKSEAEVMLTNDLHNAERDAESLSMYQDLSPARQAVLIEMCFNLGLPGVREFKRMLSALIQQEYGHAASEMIESDWARQVGTRATELSKQMQTGQWL